MPRRSLLLASALALALPTAAAAAPTAVDVRIEGKTSTIFTGPVTTDGKTVNPQSGGAHICDGTNGDANPSPGPTATSALDDAAIKGGFGWTGTWFGSFGDYSVDSVAGESSTSSEFWGVFVNGESLMVGGCQFIVEAGDEVLWTFDAFSKLGALKLAAPAATQTGKPIEVKVANRATGAPIAGASVGAATTAADGTASLSFAEPGVYRLKAEKAAWIRSSELRVCVDPPLVEACTSTDRTAPSVRNDAPAVSSSTARFNYVRLSWQGDDGATGSGVRRYRVERRRIDVPGPWKAVVTDGTGTQKHVPGRAGESYEFRVQAIDRAGNASGWVSRTTAVPFDNLSHRLRFSKTGWKTLARQGAFKLSVSRATRRGATASIRFTGTQATIVTRKLRNGGRIAISVDGGEPKVVDLRGRGRFRRKLVATKALERGEHTLRVKSLSGAPVEIDAVAVKP
jgi:hypothetical protein